MEKFTKCIITSLIVLAFGGTLYATFFKLLPGNWFAHAGFMTVGLLIIAILSLAFYGFKFTKWIWQTDFTKCDWFSSSLAILIIAGIAGACSYAKSNQQVVVSTDCGMTWARINAGDAVPVGTGNRCFMKVVMPNYPMQGESKFITNLKERVRVQTQIDYDYSIVNPLAFINQAKYLGKANADVDSEGALAPKEFETAENMVIDKRIKDVAKELFIKEDVVELDQSELEDRLLETVNKVLEPLGVKLNFITLTFDLDTQTREAIDVATAMKIYESKNLSEIGKKIMEARAGSTKITIEQKEEKAPE